MAKKKTTSRRGNNEGSIYQREDGYWIAMVTIGRDENGKRIRKVYSGKTKAEVTIKMTQATMDKLTGVRTSVTNDTIEVLMTEWLFTFKRAEVTSRTFEKCVCNAKLHIFPTIGNFKIDQINSSILQGLLNKMLFRGYALASVRKVKFLLNQFFEYMKKCKFIQENPVNDCKVKSTAEHKEQKQEQYKAIPEEVRQNFLEVIQQSETLYPICMMQIFAGLRIGETLALKWKDVDFNKDCINIDNAITVDVSMNEKGKIIKRKTIISDTKTAASIRVVPLSPTLKECLLNWQRTRWAKQFETGISFVEPDDLVFSNNKGELRTYYGTKRMFDRLMKNNGLEKYHFHFHTMRHTFSTMLWEEKENPKVIQMLLGHADVSTTIKTYNSVDNSYFKRTTSILEDKLKKK